MEFKVLGIDPGSMKVGFAIIKVAGQRLTRIKSGREEVPKFDKPKRLLHISNVVKHLVLKNKVNVIGMESGFVGKGWQTSLVIAEARGAILAALAMGNVPIIEISPSKAKISVGLGGNAKKIDVQYAVQSIFQLKELPSEDEADSFAVAVATANALQSPL